MSISRVTRAIVPALFLTAATAVAQPANDNCATATPIAVPSTTAGEILTATISFDLPKTCDSFLGVFDPDVWYTITGDGNDVTVSTCADLGGAADFNTQIVVMTGDCAGLVCLAGNDDDGTCSDPFASTVTFCAESGVEYFIAVTGFLETGNFTLAALDDGLCTDHGACCFDGAPCEHLLEADCLLAGGMFQGIGVECGVVCGDVTPVPLPAWAKSLLLLAVALLGVVFVNGRLR